MTVRAGDIMAVDFPSVDANETLRAAIQQIVEAHIPAIPVIDADRNLAGLLTQMDILHLVLQGRDIDTTQVGDAVHGYSALGLDDVLERPQDATVAGTGIGPVVRDGKLLGVVMPVDVAVEQQLVDTLGKRASSLNREISPDDEMYHGVRSTYLRDGLWALAQIKEAMKSAGLYAPAQNSGSRLWPWAGHEVPRDRFSERGADRV